MSKEFENEPGLEAPQEQADVVTLIKKMQQQISALDKKIEILLSRPQERSFGEKRFSRPPHSFGHHSFHGRDDRRYERESFGNRGSFHSREDREGSFRERHSGEGRSFGKKSFYSDRPHGGEPKEFAPKKKPFFLKRKERG